MSKKIIGIAGSPRKGGNSEILLDTVLNSAAEAGSEIKKISVRDLEFKPCIGCGNCEKTGLCVFKDDMPQLIAEVMEADVVILASPMYFMNVPGKMKSFIDRFQTVWSKKYILKQPLRNDDRKRTGIVIGVGGTGVKDLFDGFNILAKVYFHILEMEFDQEHSIYFRKVENRGEIKENDSAISDAVALGKYLAGS